MTISAHWQIRDRQLFEEDHSCGIAVLGATLTLIAFSRYAVGFGTRCFFIALAASFAGGASGIAEERVANVIVGGVFGLVAVALMELVWRRGGAGKVGVSQ